MKRISTKCMVTPTAGGVASFSKRVTAKNKVNSFKMKMKLFRWRT